ncbi:hypothetical protein EUX98_g7363 [Antrodiella citrinella]|uniref:Ran-GTPase activating protein 1 C-terminal domain-containing protein n=1 Tax=Antrodiella citrinella TaxID=2447956 RepID=A0A4V3XHV4_9APHY|nr:hypothetical protein EUX98_g7363 [Antrodiella citrinella]
MASNSKILSLHGKVLKLNTRADVEPYLTADPATLEEIHFGGNTIGVEAALAIADYLKKTEVLKVADFADIFTGRLITEIPQALSAICDALVDKTSLVEINLSDNAFGGRSVDPMVNFLTNNRSFQILRLNNNGLGPEGGAVVANALIQSALLSKKAGVPSNLRTVICGRNRLEDGSAPVWGEALKAHGLLTRIEMTQNGIKPDGISALVRGIAACTGLVHLNLQDNTFGEKGSLAAAEVLKSWPLLETLNFADCVIGQEGDVSPIVPVLLSGSNTKLTVLQLANNNMDSQSFALFAEGIQEHLPALKTFEVFWNEVEEDDEGIVSLSGTMTKRGGKLVITDPEEEEDEDEEEEEKEEEKKPEVIAPAPTKDDHKDATDALTELLGKVSISSSSHKA